MKKILVSIFVFICIISFAIIIISNDKLSDSQISEIRKQYPTFGEYPALIEVVTLPIDYYIQEAETFVYGEIKGEMKTFSNKGFDFFEYELTVLDDSLKKLKKGEKICIFANMGFVDYFPKLSDKMKIIVPVNNDYENRYSYSPDAIFFVNEDDYAISVVEENTYSGLKVKDLLKKLSKKHAN